MEAGTINKMGGWLLVGATLLTIVGFTLIGYKYGLNSAVRRKRVCGHNVCL